MPDSFGFAPTAEPDTTIGEPVEVDVLANDSDPDDDIDTSTLSIVEQGQSGVATIDLSGPVPLVVYTPGQNPGSDIVTYEVCDAYGCVEAVITIEIETTTQACEVASLDSFQQGPWVFTFQLRNTTSTQLDVELVIAGANYELTNLVFNGAGTSPQLIQEQQADGTFTITISASLPPYQSIGRQQPNGFGGSVQPISAQPQLCSAELG